MEHSALHGLLLTGLILTLGGPLAVLCLFLPAGRALGPDPQRDSLVSAMVASAGCFVMIGAGIAAFATFCDFFVGVAEIHGLTVFSGIDAREVLRFSVGTMVGNLCVARIALLLLVIGAARARSERKWPFVALLATASVLVTSLVSHAAAQPEHRFSAIAFQFGHIAAGAAWIGVLLHLYAARKTMLAQTNRPRLAFIAKVVQRFSPIALAATSLLAITGVIAAIRFVGEFGAIFTSAYGLTLLVKLALLIPVVFAGYINFRFNRPALSRAAAAQPLAAQPMSAAVLHRFLRTLELEVTAGVLLIIVAGVLGSVSPPGPDGSLRLTEAQTRAFPIPHLPTTAITNPADDPVSPVVTVEDMRYSEFTHNWSGVMVTLLGLCWLGMSVGGRIGFWSARLSPFLLIPFGCFIAILANPELWWLRQISPLQALRDPIIVEHQLGGVMVFVLAWLSWRDRKNHESLRPLGYALPIIMIAGSLLLLGHAHSALGVPDDLTNLINVQHAIFGAFGLFAGASRFLFLRGLMPGTPSRFVWPSFVMGLGLFMAFFYREVV
jgi:putative copper export protein